MPSVPRRFFFKGQIVHLLLLIFILVGAFLLVDFEHLRERHLLEVDAQIWFVIALVVPVVHQIYVWLAWRIKICFGAVTKRYSTLAHLVGEEKRIPTDRPVDSINQADFLLGKREQSNREYVVTFVGDDVFSVKWRTLKVHFFTAEGTFSPIVKHTFPPVYDIKNDPGETRELWRSEGYSHIWVMKPVTEIIGKLQASMAKYPNIKPRRGCQGIQVIGITNLASRNSLHRINTN